MLSLVNAKLLNSAEHGGQNFGVKLTQREAVAKNFEQVVVSSRYASHSFSPSNKLSLNSGYLTLEQSSRIILK